MSTFLIWARRVTPTPGTFKARSLCQRQSSQTRDSSSTLCSSATALSHTRLETLPSCSGARLISALSFLLSNSFVSASPQLSSTHYSRPSTPTQRRTRRPRTSTCLLCMGTTKQSKTRCGTRQEGESSITTCSSRIGCASSLPLLVHFSFSFAATTTTLRASYLPLHSSRVLFTPTFRDKLLEINERHLWVDPSHEEEWSQRSEQEQMQQDDQIFNTARLINCGHFASAVFGDYLHSWVSSCSPFLFLLTLAQDPQSLQRTEPLVARSVRRN
jgi:hypothetical protein